MMTDQKLMIPEQRKLMMGRLEVVAES